MLTTDRFPSHHYLSKQALTWLKRELNVEAWVLDAGAISKFNLKKNDKVDVLLMGNFLYEILLFRFWPKKQYRFWVLSRATKNVLVHLIGIPEKSIDIVPRDKLLPQKRISKDKNALIEVNADKQDLCFVYSGRLSRSKNILLLLQSLRHLQKLTHRKHKLLLFGNVDGYGIEDRNIKEEDTKFHLELIKKELKQPDWLLKPKILGQLGPKDWLSHVPKNAIGISLSRHMKEDFGLALAQLNSIGIPLLISQWGGHLDLGEARFIPLTKICHPADSDKHRLASAKKIAKLLIRPSSLGTNKLASKLNQETLSSKTMYAAFEHIEKRINQSLRSYQGAKLCWTYLDLSRYLASKEGQSFFKKYVHYFSLTNKSN